MTQVAADVAVPVTPQERSTGQLAIALSDQVSRLVKAEIELAQAEVKSSIGKIGAGAGMLAAAALLGLCLVICLLVAGGLGLAQAFPSWLAALIEAAVFLVLTGLLALLGLRAVKRGGSPVPQEAIAGLRTDLAVVKQVKP